MYATDLQCHRHHLTHLIDGCSRGAFAGCQASQRKRVRTMSSSPFTLTHLVDVCSRGAFTGCQASQRERVPCTQRVRAAHASKRTHGDFVDARLGKSDARCAERAAHQCTHLHARAKLLGGAAACRVQGKGRGAAHSAQLRCERCASAHTVHASCESVTGYGMPTSTRGSVGALWVWECDTCCTETPHAQCPHPHRKA